MCTEVRSGSYSKSRHLSLIKSKNICMLQDNEKAMLCQSYHFEFIVRYMAVRFCFIIRILPQKFQVIAQSVAVRCRANTNLWNFAEYYDQNTTSHLYFPILFSRCTLDQTIPGPKNSMYGILNLLFLWRISPIDFRFSLIF